MANEIKVEKLTLSEDFKELIEHKEDYEVALYEEGMPAIHLAIYPEKGENGEIRIGQVDEGCGTIFNWGLSTCYSFDEEVDVFLARLRKSILKLHDQVEEFKKTKEAWAKKKQEQQEAD